MNSIDRAKRLNLALRKAGHSLTKDRRSNGQNVILHGMRADNEDKWCESFSTADIDDPTDLGFPMGDVLYSRALLRLGEKLFPELMETDND